MARPASRAANASAKRFWRPSARPMEMWRLASLSWGPELPGLASTSFFRIGNDLRNDCSASTGFPMYSNAVPLRVRLDVFHTRREGERALRRVWSWAEGLWDQAAQVERAKGRFDRGGTDRRRFSQAALRKAWVPAEAAFTQAQAQ